MVFAVIAVVTMVGAFLAPPLFNGLNYFLGWLTKLDRAVFLAALAGLILVSRLLLVEQMLPIVPGHDTGHYFQLANTLLEEGRFIEYASKPTEPDGYRAWRLPGYPAALSIALLVTGRQRWSVVALNAVWMVVLVLSMYLLVRELASEHAARLASLAVASYPTLLTASLEAMNELQFASLLVVSAYLLFGKPGGKGSALLGGVVMGLATLTRGNGLVMFPVLLVAYPTYLVLQVSRKRSMRWTRRELLLRTGVLAAGFMLTIAPWTVRNRLVLGEWVALATSGGANMWIGHHPGATGVPRRALNPRWPPGLGEKELARYGARESIKYWLAEPITNLRIGGRIVVQILKVDSGAMPLIYREGTPTLGDPGRSLYLFLFGLFNFFYYGAWALVGVWGATRALGRWPPDGRPGILLLIALLYVGTFIPFVGWARYKIPVLPFLAAASAMILAALAAPTERPLGNLRVDSKLSLRGRAAVPGVG